VRSILVCRYRGIIAIIQSLGPTLEAKILVLSSKSCPGPEASGLNNKADKQTFVSSGYFYRTSSSPLLLRSAPDTERKLSLFHAEAPQATASEGLAQGPYVAARAGFEPTILRTKGDESTNEQPKFLWFHKN